MKELIEKILTYLPRYLMDFGMLFSGPKRFMATKNTADEETFAQSLIFLGISLVLCVVMTAPLLPPGADLWTYLGMKTIVSSVAISLYAVNLRFAWRLVGGKATVRSFFVTYAYHFGVISVIFVAFLLLSEGYFKTLAPQLYAEVIQAKLNKQPMPDVSGSSAPVISFLILIAGLLLVSLWAFIGWGAYRQLNGLSRRRSFVALAISGLLGWPIVAIVFLIESAMTVK